jgi:hypothetical protein
MWQIGLSLVLPVGLGLVAGIAALSNLLEWFLQRHRRPTLGLLLGLLLGSVLGLYPFKPPNFDKLVRYAVEPGENQPIPAGTNVLWVWLYGQARWDDSTPIKETLETLDETRGDIVVAYAGVNATAPTVADVESAAQQKAVLLAYDVAVPRPVRRAAQQAGVPLIIIPDTQLTLPRAASVLALIAAGFVLTYTLGSFGGNSNPKSETRKPKHIHDSE